MPLIFVTVVPEIPPASERLVRIESPVTFHMLVASRLRAAELIEPVSDELFFRVAVIELMLSASSEPAMVSPSAVKATVPPLLPVVPHLSVADALMSVPDISVTFTPFSIIEAFVFVMKNAGPATAVNDPPFMVNVPVPVAASPEKLW